MFICENCKAQSLPEIQSFRLITKRRNREYPENKTFGSEIVKEITVCESCFNMLKESSYE